jgi:hypothetical protein
MSKAKTFTISKAYVLSAISKAGQRVYFDTDGYPYWSTYASSAKKFDSLEKIPTIGSEHYMRNDVTVIEVLEVEMRAKVVSTTEIVSEARAKAMAEIAKIEQELRRKVAMLEGTK